MTREEAVVVLKALMENPLFSEVHKVAFNIAIHDIKQRHDWDINNLILINKDNYEPLEQEPCEDWYDISSDEMTLEQTRQAVKDLRKKLAEHLEQEPFINKPCVSSGVCEHDKNKVLDKIRAEIVDLGQRTMNDNRASGIWACRDIIDKYKTESEKKNDTNRWR